MPLALIVLELGGGKRSATGWARAMGRVFKRLAANPVIIAIITGMLLAALELHLPVVVAGSLELFAKASAGVALFFVGCSLVGSPMRSRVGDISQIAIAKLIVHPLSVVAMVALLPSFDTDLQRAAVLLAACPMLSIFPILNGRYGFTQLASGALLMTTTLSFATIATVLLFL